MVVEENDFGCSNPFIDRSWCLNENRPDIKGLYFERYMKRHRW